MKKIITVLLGAVLTATAVNAQTDSTAIEYRFYPEANVYYNPVTKNYSWFDQNKASWTTGLQLPLSMKIKNEATFNTIRYPGTDIWSSNPDHIKQYGNKINPVVPAPTTTVPPPNATRPPLK